MRALPGTGLRIVDDRGEPVPHGGEGEICVSGPTLMTRYVGAPGETRRVLRGGWLHTGDFGRLDAEGGLTVLDRRTDLIVTGGENVYPAQIEAALCEHPAVLEAGVVGRADEAFGARPVAWVALRPGAGASESALRAHCAARLARFQQPIAFRFAQALPRNAAGKLLRLELRERERHLPVDG
jgi:long-chain acyl-CoA synthetase